MQELYTNANEDTGLYKKHECMYWGPFCTYKVKSNDGCRHFVGKETVKRNKEIGRAHV